MDIGALSTALSQSSLKQAVGISVLKMAKEQTVTEGQALIKMMEQSVNPNLGGNIDIKV
ncbi:YjfB family protein [Paenibacillus sp. alder61]|uniref:Putative motility protein n=1 Tax=Paenibacillus faecis TaxID=862114 RepID=A0A5D0CT96_9BACL|nr:MULTISPECIES: YjfB family protein [Paenibacillus]MCA1295121.1 YjfB family protein [Paenibacillus sp. alder61]TYA13062.1 putative motility protein [Paenibacillus faecis]